MEKMMIAAEEEEIVIVGGGICGLATALALHRKGIRSIILERSETLRAAGVGIIMQPNGWRALHQLGVASKLQETALHLASGDFVSVEDGKRRDLLGLGKGELRCLKRMDLIKALADPLPNGTVHLGCNVVSVSNHPRTSRPLLHLQDGTIIKPKILIGCDGLNSKVAKFLGIPPANLFTRCATRGFTYYQKCHNYGDTFRVFSSENAQLGVLPITDTLIYWFLTRPLNPQDSGSSKKDQNFIKDAAVKVLKDFPEHAVELVKKSDLNSLYLTELWYRTPYDILTASFNKGNVAVAGDAMHAMCPFISQGGGASLEDAVVLARNLLHKLALMDRGYKGGSMIEEALAEYVKERRMRLFWLSMQTYLIGLTLSQSKLKKFLGILGLIFIIRDPKTHTDYDCGQL